MANISPVIQIDIAAPGSSPELITLGASCSEQEIEEYKGPYIVQTCLGKGAYILADSEGHPFSNPRNGLYLKHFYP